MEIIITFTVHGSLNFKMQISHFYESLGGGIHQILLETDDITLAKMYLEDGKDKPSEIVKPEIIRQLRGAGLLLSTAAMVLKVAENGVKTREECEIEREKRWSRSSVD